MSKYGRIDLTRFEGHTKGEWCIYDGNLMVRTDEISVRLAEPYSDDGITEDENTINKELMISAPDLLAELKRYYGFVDELLNYFHHTILENESFMDLMYRMGVFEFEPEPWQNEKGEWMIFVGDTYETGEWVVDKDFTPPPWYEE